MVPQERKQSPSVGLPAKHTMVISKENSAGGPRETADIILSHRRTPEGGLGRRHQHSHLFSAAMLSAFLWTGFFSRLLRTPALLGNLS